MKLVFRHRSTIKLRIIIAVIVALTLVIFDFKSTYISRIRSYLDILVSPVYFITNSLRELLDNISEFFVRRDQLIIENRALKKEVMLKTADNLLLKQIKQENANLREILGSPLLLRHKDTNMMITQVISCTHTPYRDQIIIDKGLHNGVYEGQPVISEKGVVGQVIAVSQFNSRVLLICDINHAIPIQILRNGMRVIASGTGCNSDLKFEPLPANLDLRIGDIVVTSGLDGRFPEGYPVAIISSVKHDMHRASTIVRAHLIADLKRLRYLLLLLK